MRYIKDLGKEVSVCPCCGAELHEGVISTKEEQIQEIAKRMGVKIKIDKTQENISRIGLKEEEPVPMKEVITTDNVLEKLAPELVEESAPISLEATKQASKPKKKVTKKFN